MVLCGIRIPDFHKRILFSDEVHFWLNGYVNKQNCRFWSEANPQVYVKTPLHPEKLTVWCALCYTRAFGDGPRNFEPWSSDVDDTRAGTPSPNYHTTPTGGRFSSQQI
ncbi:putative DD41D transposase [Trichonephila clavipes]|nr:putative DD41D transposase [Trichonephila clavipes]